MGLVCVGICSDSARVSGAVRYRGARSVTGLRSASSVYIGAHWIRHCIKGAPWLGLSARGFIEANLLAKACFALLVVVFEYMIKT